MSKKQKNQGLGRQLIKNKRKEHNVPIQESNKHTTDLEQTRESILDQSDLNAVIAHAELSGKKFVAEKQRAVIISRDAFQLETVDPRRTEEMEKHWNDLTIPKRPKWDETTTPDELKKKENESFLEWRRSLSVLEQNEHLLLTPFEKNLEVWRQLWRVVERSTLVVQIVDARNPLLFRSIDLENWVTSLGKSKLLLVNKADFLTEKQRSIWAEYFKKENVEFAFFSATSDIEVKDFSTSPSKIYSKYEILDLFIEICKKFKGNSEEKQSDNNSENRYIVGMVGYPNVGKSSTINLLLEEKKVAVSKTPGKTKHFQTLNIPDRPITLCDCPGLVFPTFMSTRAEMVCNGLIRISELRDVLSPISVICRIIPRNILESIYGIVLPTPKEYEDPKRPPTADELLNAYGYIRGFMTRHGVPDQSRAGKIILEDFVMGKLLYCHPPPYSADDFNSVIRNMSTINSNQGNQFSNNGSADQKDEKCDNDNENSVEIDSNFGGINIRTFDIVEERDPNDHRKQESGRKKQKRQKKKIILENQTGAYIAGKKHANYSGTHHVGTKPLPTNIKLTGKRTFTVPKTTHFD